MSKIADRIKSRKRDKQFVDVPAWGEDGEPERVYYGPFLAGELNRIQRKHKDFLGNPTLEGMVDLIILKALDEEGENIFTLADKPVLMRESVGVIAEVAGTLMSGDNAEDMEKN